ncbi:hypothetical protein D9756_003013 [Leucocoprinus leucothites]|uniref:Uncharacterized protein n=1 Tax=Leucocoprinus leucothites TaxID=201217 RepID=A0A8H5G7D4_9AGAR|nr:hypothetical protein D9756_003013 [Leucoagaricus leucothites]
MNYKLCFTFIVSSMIILAAASPVPVSEVVTDVSARESEVEEARGCGQFCI